VLDSGGVPNSPTLVYKSVAKIFSLINFLLSPPRRGGPAGSWLERATPAWSESKRDICFLPSQEKV